jgi:hypothetical protein
MSLNHVSKHSELTDAHFAAIGRVVVEWSNVEFLLRSIPGHLLITPSFLARTYTDRLSAAKVQEAIDEAVEIQRLRYQARIVPTEVLEEITEINRKITTLRANRNKFAHYCWCRTTDEEIFGTRFGGGVRESKRTRKDFVVLSVKELEGFYREAYEIVDTLAAIREKLPEMEEDGIRTKLA